MEILDKLAQSKFRSSFKLTEEDTAYIERVGVDKIRAHARDFVVFRLAPAYPENDGKQTPFKGHPVFKAQHATATCCRTCLTKWHNIPEGRDMTETEIEMVIDLIMQWILLNYIES